MENGTAAVHRAKGSIDRLSFSGTWGTWGRWRRRRTGDALNAPQGWRSRASGGAANDGFTTL